MAKKYNPPPSMSDHAGVQLMNDKQQKQERRMIRLEAMKFAVAVMSEKEKDFNKIIDEAKKIEDYIEYGSTPVKSK
tara:strand:- start:1607 stop:1834 length:228 start_codon:yes stop_codon:yes gene_type:complete